LGINSKSISDTFEYKKNRAVNLRGSFNIFQNKSCPVSLNTKFLLFLNNAKHCIYILQRFDAYYVLY